MEEANGSYFLATRFVICTLFVVSTAVESSSTMINGGFETGDLTRWETLGDVSIQTSSFGSGPAQGSYQAVLTNDVLVTSPQKTTTG